MEENDVETSDDVITITGRKIDCEAAKREILVSDWWFLINDEMKSK